MKALFFTEHGTVDNLQYGDIPTPTIKPDEVLVQVHACSLNHLDLWVLEGWPGLKLEMPHTGGADIAGTIKEVGDSITNWQPGDRVVLNPGFATKEDEFTKRGEECLSPSYKIFGEGLQGGFAKFVKAPAKTLAKIPDNIDFQTAASSLLVSLTAWRMLTTRAKLKAGETVLIVGAGGGVNSVSIQIAKHLGAKVIALTSTAKKTEHALSLGAEQVINYRECPGWGKKIQELTNRRGVDVVVDNVGQSTINQSILAVARGGRIVTVGNTSGPVIKIDNRYIFSKQISLIGSTMGSYTDFEQVLKLLWSKAITPVIDSSFPLKDGKNAYNRLEKGEQFGKIMLIPE